MVLEISLQYAENIHCFGQTQDPQRVQRFQEEEVHVVQLLGNHGLEIKIQSPNNPERTSSVVICQGQFRLVN